MKITVHRGIDQIGGCITEISSNTTSILIDLGQNLPDGNGFIVDDLANKSSIENITRNVDAIFYSHYHGDHIGNFHFVLDKIPQYIGSIAKQVILCKHKRLSYIKGREVLSEKELLKISKMKTFIPNQPIVIGDIKITPYFVSHSAYDSYIFLIEADGKRTLHTGDFRGHGYLSKGLIPTVKKLILKKGQIDILITEGTMISRLDERVRHENELKKEVIELAKEYKNVFIMCSSTDMERLATFYAANKKNTNRPFICDDFQKDILKIFTDSAGLKSQLFNFEKNYSFNVQNDKLINWMKDKGFCMLTRATKKFEDYWKFLKPKMDMKETILVYSMWKEYINPKSKHRNQKYLDFVGQFPNFKKIHTSGHASAECLAEFCSTVNPSIGIIPIHSEKSENYKNLKISNELKNKVITRSTTLDGIEVIIDHN